MATVNLNAAIQERVEAFSMELMELVRQATVDVVQSALARTDGLSRRSGGQGRASEGPSRALEFGQGAARGRRRGAKRDPGELESLTDSLLDYIRANAGQRIEEVARGMGTSTKELSLPARKLLATRKVKTKGQKRATQYFPR